MKEYAKSKAIEFIKKYKYYKPDLSRLRGIIESQGFVIVEYNGVSDDANVTNIVKSLNLTEQIRGSKAFTYVAENLRLVFLNEDLSDDEKLVVLMHEEGHIFCEHFSKGNIMGKDIMQEREANEFSHYVAIPSMGVKVAKHKFVLLIVAIAICLVIGLTAIITAVNKQKSHFGEYYIVGTRTTYHQEACVHVKNKTNTHRLTKDEFDTGIYTPCQMCLPE